MSRHRFTTAVMAAALLTVPSLANKAEKTPGFTTKIPGTDTELTVYGSVRVDVTHNNNGDPYFKDPLLCSRVDGYSLYRRDGISATNKMNLDKTRFGFMTVTPNAGLDSITTKLEFECDGSYGEAKVGLKLRQAAIGFGNWLIGRTVSTFVDTEAGLDVLSPSAPIGQPNFSVSNFNLIRYTNPISRLVTFTASLEDSVSKPKFAVESKDPSTHSPTEVKKDFARNSRCPNVVGALTYDDYWGHIGVRVLEQNWSVVHGEDSRASRTKWACATQLSGAVKIGMDKLVGTIYTGKGLGDYGANAPLTDNAIIKTTNDVSLNNQTGWQLGYTHNWNDKVRSNIAASGINIFSHSDGFSQNNIKYAQDQVVNTMVNVAKGVEVGMECLLQKTKVKGDDSAIKSTDARRVSPGGHLCSSRISMVLTAKF